jgi:hypothetical protein
LWEDLLINQLKFFHHRLSETQMAEVTHNIKSHSPKVIARALLHSSGQYISDQDPYGEYSIQPDDIVCVASEADSQYAPKTPAERTDPNFHCPKVWCGIVVVRGQEPNLYRTVDSFWYAPLGGMAHLSNRSGWEWLTDRGITEEEAQTLSRGQKIAISSKDDKRCCVIGACTYTRFQAVFNSDESMQLPGGTIPPGPLDPGVGLNSVP